MRITVTADTAAVEFLFNRAERAFDDMSRGPMRDGFAEAGNTYLVRMRERFKAEGEGTWRQLAPRTREDRQELGFSPAHPILRRLGYLYRGLIPGQPGNAFVHDKDGVAVGYGGSALHPGYAGRRTKEKVPIAKIARFHQTGTAKMVARQVIAVPDVRTVLRIRSILARAAAETIRQMRVSSN